MKRLSITLLTGAVLAVAPLLVRAESKEGTKDMLEKKTYNARR